MDVFLLKQTNKQAKLCHCVLLQMSTEGEHASFKP